MTVTDPAAGLRDFHREVWHMQQVAFAKHRDAGRTNHIFGNLRSH